MEITNISGPDVMPPAFSTEAPRQEERQQRVEQPVTTRSGESENNRGTIIDTYA